MPIELKDCVVYDIEVVNDPTSPGYSWESPFELGFASAVAYDYATDQYINFLHKERLPDLLKLLNGRTAISFNGIKFDSRVVLGNDRLVNKWGTTRNKDRSIAWRNYDILAEYVKYRFEYTTVGEAEERLGDKKIHDGTFSLDGLAQGTFGLHKTGHGAHAPVLYHEKKYDDLLSYNLNDVRLTKKLFDFIRKYGFVVDREGRAVRITV